MAHRCSPSQRLPLLAALLVAAAPGIARAAADRALSNFPATVEGNVRAAAAVADLDGDGHPDVVLGAGEVVTAFSHSGQVLPGFPVGVGAAVAGPVAVARVGDAAWILAVTRAGKVYLLHGDGTAVPGFPVTLPGGATAGGALLDVDGDGRPEVVVGDGSGRLHAFRVPRAPPGRARTRKGKRAAPPPPPRELPGFPVKLGAGVTSAPALADLGGPKGPAWALVVGCADGTVHVIGARGRERAGFPVHSAYLVSGTPAVADLDADGTYDLVFTSQDYRLYAVDAAGHALPGFPVKAGYRIYGGPALADLDGDGHLEVAFASADGHLYVVDARGRMRRGFPVDLGARVEGGVVDGDLDGDGHPDLMVATTDGRLHALDRRGRALRGWRARVRGKVVATPTLADFTGDGYVALFVGDLQGHLDAWRTTRRAKGTPSLPWPTTAHDPARTGRLHPTPSRFVDPKVAPAHPITTDALTATWTYVDLDREPPGTPEIRWFEDGKAVADLAGQRTVPAARTAKGQRWRFEVREPRDGARARWFRSTQTLIGDAVPSPPGVTLAPARPTTGAALKAVIATASTDADGDRLAYHYAWTRDGQAVKLPPSAATVPAGRIHKGQVWRVTVRAFDGTQESTPVEAATRVVNSAPGAPRVALVPAAPRITDALRVKIVRPATDVDGDALHDDYAWTVDGHPADLATDAATFPAGLAHKGQKVAVTVRADDGEVAGAGATASVTVADTAPTAPEVALVPARPTTGETLRVRLVHPATDPDPDPLHYVYAWRVDGKATTVTGPAVPGAQVHARQTWQVTVVAHDDQVAGGQASATVAVVDSPPTAPAIALQPPDPLPGEALAVRVRVPARDPDGDPVTLGYAWTVDGHPGGTGATVDGAKVKKGQVWRVEVTPTDGTLQGPVARASVTVGDRPPPAPSVKLTPARPLGGQALHAEVDAGADPDGDPVTVSRRWFRDGAAVKALDDASAVPGSRVKRDQVWTVRVRAGDGTLWSRWRSATVRVGDRPPTAPKVTVTPGKARTTDALTCRVDTEAADPDGDPVTTTLRWERGGAPTAFVGATLPASATRRGDAWRCLGTARAGGVTVAGTPSAAVAIADAPPGAPKVVIEPASPRTGTALRCALAAPAADADGDPVTYTVRWWQDGRPVAGLTSATVPGARVHKGDRWRCRLTPSDGTLAGPGGEARTRVGNTPPGAPGAVTVTPVHPAAGTDLKCTVTAPATDADRDRLTYGYKWYLDGALQPFAPTSILVRGRLVAAGQHWRCGVVAEDGAATGPETRSAQVTVSGSKVAERP